MRHPSFFSIVIVLIAGLTTVVSATPIFSTPTTVTILPNVTFGSNAVNAANTQVQWNVRFVAGKWEAVRSDGTTYLPPSGVALTGSVQRSSELGTYGVYDASCSGVACSVVFSGSGANATYNLVTNPQGVTVSQISESGKFVGNVGGNPNGITGNINSSSPFGSLAGFFGYVSSVMSGVTTTSGTVAVGFASSLTGDGSDGRAALFFDNSANFLSPSSNSAALALSLNTLLATGFEDGLLVSWNRLNGNPTYYNDKNGNRQFGVGLSVVSTGAIGGVDQNGRGIIYLPSFGYFQSPCSLSAATGGPSLSQYVDQNGECTIGKLLVTESTLGPFAIGASGSGLKFEIDQALYSAQSTGGGSQVPEPSPRVMMLGAALLLAAFKYIKGQRDLTAN